MLKFKIKDLVNYIVAYMLVNMIHVYLEITYATFLRNSTTVGKKNLALWYEKKMEII